MARQIREEIWDLLKSKGFKESAHSGKILRKDVEIMKKDSLVKLSITVKYKFGKNNLQKFHDEFKKYSIPFKHLSIVDGKIIKI